MKAKYIMAIAALGSTLAIARPCSAEVLVSTAPTSPPGPAKAVWDGSDYVGQVNGQYYYLGPNNTWMDLKADPARQQRFEEFQQNNPNWNNPKWNNPNVQNGQVPYTRSGGQYVAYPPVVMGPYPTSWSDPSAQPAGIRNTRHQGHDMGQTHAVAPPLVQTTF